MPSTSGFKIRRGESLCRLDRTAYRRRNVVERCFNKLKHNKALMRASLDSQWRPPHHARLI